MLENLLGFLSDDHFCFDFFKSDHSRLEPPALAGIGTAPTRYDQVPMFSGGSIACRAAGVVADQRSDVLSATTTGISAASETRRRLVLSFLVGFYMSPLRSR